MSTINHDNRTKEELIKEFLNEVESKLPFYLKGEKGESDEILEELENHIWDKATELADGNDPTYAQIQLVISQMGKPSQIAAEYKRRGKPKYYISEELFPMYLKTLIVIGALMFGINLLITLFSIGNGGLAGTFFGGLTTSLAMGLIFVTIVFVTLSHEGYFPEDFQRYSSRIPGSIRSIFETKKKDERIESAAYEGPSVTQTEATAVPSKKVEITDDPKVRIVKESYPVKTQPQTIKETIILDKQQEQIPDYRRPVPKRTVKYKKHKTGRNYLSDGIANIVFGSVIIILVFTVLDFLAGSKYYPLNYWVIISGAITISLGTIRFTQAMIGRNLRLQQGMLFLGTIPKAAEIPLHLVLIKTVAGFGPYNVQMMNLFEAITLKLNELFNTTWVFDEAIGMRVLKILVYVTIALKGLNIISELSKIAKLETEGFPVIEKEITEYR